MLNRATKAIAVREGKAAGVIDADDTQIVRRVATIQGDRHALSRDKPFGSQTRLLLCDTAVLVREADCTYSTATCTNCRTILGR